MAENMKNTNTAGEDSLPVTSYWKDVIRRFCKNRIAVIGLIALGVIVILCTGAPLFTKYDPVVDMDFMNMLAPPGSEGHILGTDDLGRDIWCRLLYGGRSSLVTGLSVALLAAVIGVVIGLYSGYFGGIIEALLMRFTDIMLSFPYCGHRHHVRSGFQPEKHHHCPGHHKLAKVCKTDQRPGPGREKYRVCGGGKGGRL